MNNRFKNRVPFFTVIGQAYLSDQIEDAENNVWKIDTIDGGVILFDHVIALCHTPKCYNCRWLVN